MVPAYNAQGFAGVDLRKYHIRDMKDAIRFIEFVFARMEELKHVINKFNTKHNTLNAVVKQMQAQQQKINDLYGSPTSGTFQPVQVEDTEKAVVETAEVKNDSAEREALLDEMRQAVANENLKAEVSDAYDDNLIAEFEKYKAVQTATKVMYYREGKMVSVKDIPEDIRDSLLEQLDSQKQPTEEE